MKTSISKKNKIRIYKIIALVIAAAAIYCLAAFSNMPPIDKRCVVTMTGIDFLDGGVRVTAHILLPVSQNESKQFKQDTLTADAKDIFEAVEKFNVMQGRKVEFSQCGVLVLGRGLLDAGVSDTLQAMYASNLIGAGAIVLAADNGTAAEFLQAVNDLGEETSENIGTFLRRFQTTTAMPKATLLSVLGAETGESRSMAVPRVEIEYKEGMQPQEEGGESSGGGGGEGGDKPGLSSKADIKSVSTAVILKDGKRAGALSEYETQGYMYTQKSSVRGSFYIENFTFEGRELGPVYGQIRRKSVRTKTYFTPEGKPEICYRIKLKIEPKYTADFSRFQESKLYAALAEEVQKSIQAQVIAAVEASKNLDADYMQIKYRFYRTQNKKIKAFEGNPENLLLRDVAVRAEVRVKI
ncbi:MAG: Ger(x)C family spore germination C-terminal domain-containing protein [Firmicutes bacterium]|nr:Ger(x)C family spore germination C-terminal domain-containing protein [Bacillota bacterium]